MKALEQSVRAMHIAEKRQALHLSKREDLICFGSTILLNHTEDAIFSPDFCDQDGVPYSDYMDIEAAENTGGFRSTQ